jgi:hypothetical protein
MNPFFRRSTFWKDLLPICWKSQPILFGLLQGAHVAVAVRLLLVFLLFLPVRWTRTTKYAKKRAKRQRRQRDDKRRLLLLGPDPLQSVCSEWYKK